jgi:hypothetical protein
MLLHAQLRTRRLSKSFRRIIAINVHGKNEKDITRRLNLRRGLFCCLLWF